MKKLMIVAGEMSGDQHAAGLVRELREARGDVECFGIGGEAMRRSFRTAPQGPTSAIRSGA